MKVQSIAIAAVALFALTQQASAADTCRRFVPSAGITIAVPCSDQVASPATAAPAAATKVAVAGPQTAAAPKIVKPADTTVQTAPDKQPTAKPTQTAQTRDAKRCGDILDRAQRGPVTSNDMKTLRTDCRT